MVTANRIKRVVLIAPKSTGGNFEYVAIPRQGLLYLSGALRQWQGEFLYEREVWYEDRCGQIDPDKDLEKTDLLLVTALINEAPRAYEIARKAKAYHPNLKVIGGGPQMSPLAEEALRATGMDAIVTREGEDVIGPLCDLMLKYDGAALKNELRKFPGIAFLDEEGRFVENPRHGVIQPNYVELPDFASMKDLTPGNPLAAGIIETVRGCTEKCTYCQVIQQFLGYRMVPRETELRRLAQLRKLAEDGLIFSAKDGRFSVFISDDLHPPPLRAVKYRDERVARLRNWKGHTEGMWMICQTRAEIGQDPELAEAMRDAGIRMLYVGVESSNAKNLELVKKRQDPTRMHKDMTYLNELGFVVCAMTIIGLPYDTEESIMEMAQWARTVSRYQTANWLTPLPATINWKTLIPLDEDGAILPQGKMRPYHLYTGRQLVHHDQRWGLQKSREVFAKYTGELRAVDNLYERIFKIFRSKAYYEVLERRRQEEFAPYTLPGRESITTAPRVGVLAGASGLLAKLADSLSAKMNQLEASLASSIADITSTGQVAGQREWRESIAARVRELQETSASKLTELRETVVAKVGEARHTLSSATDDLREGAASRLDEVGASVSAKVGELRDVISQRINVLRQSLASSSSELCQRLSVKAGAMQETFSARITEITDAASASLEELKANLKSATPGRKPGPPQSA